jgi:hypothetical protein
MDGWMDGFKKIEFEETELQARIRKEAKDAEHDVIEGIGNKTQVGEKIHLADGSLGRFVIILNTASRVHFLRTQDPPRETVSEKHACITGSRGCTRTCVSISGPPSSADFHQVFFFFSMLINNHLLSSRLHVASCRPDKSSPRFSICRVHSRGYLCL